jgi:hypothetical protein
LAGIPITSLVLLALRDKAFFVVTLILLESSAWHAESGALRQTI